VTIRVTTGSRRAGVGGERDGTLVVRVRERAVEGRATEAALSALAEALGVPRRAVTLVHGATSRTKVVDVEGDDQRLEARVATLQRALAETL
jgi:uncharacterized protein YggU (UPF0235/DUF167 family)